MKFQDRNGAHAHYNIWSCYQGHNWGLSPTRKRHYGPGNEVGLTPNEKVCTICGATDLAHTKFSVVETNFTSHAVHITLENSTYID